MKVNVEALDQLHQSLLELTSIIEKTNIGPNLSVEMQQNVAHVFECVTLA